MLPGSGVIITRKKNFKLPALSIEKSDFFAIYLAEELLLQHEGTPSFDSLTWL